MNVEQVRSLDKKTASGIFAAAALASAADPGLHQSSLKKEFGDFVNPLLNDIRTKLKLAAEDNSPRARRSINEFLGQELKAVVLRTVDTSEVLSAAGQAGRLSPSLYIPEMPESFLRLFTSLGVKAQHVSDAIQRPDEYQHLYIDQSDGGSAPSLFMKLIETREPFWILVQAHRVGRVQIAHSAWRLYGREIDLTSVTEPLTALKKFVDVFGVTITVNGQEFLFVDGQRFEGKQIEANYREGTFSSLANVRDKYGLGYSIDLPKYAQSLISHGVDVKFKPGLVQQFVQATGTQPISRLKTT